MITFVLGGARSGKSSWALRYGENLRGFNKHYYVATAEALDEEMKERIYRHRKERSDVWQTIEEPVNLSLVLSKLNQKGTIVLIDCLTLWLSNVLLKDKDNLKRLVEDLEREISSFKETEEKWLIILSNEVGLGIVPESPLGRLFRDKAGWLNQRMAGIADEVYFIIAGQSLLLKGRTIEPL